MNNLKITFIEWTEKVRKMIRNKVGSNSFKKDDYNETIQVKNLDNQNILINENNDKNSQKQSDDIFSFTEKSFKNKKRRKVARLKPVNDNLSLQWYIDHKEVQIYDKIGAGSFGTVYKGFWHGYVAVKTLNINSTNEDHLTLFKNEVDILRKTRHINILLFVGCIYQPRLAIVTQWCDGDTLYNCIHVKENIFKLNHVVEISIQTCNGMGYLHAKNIIHRDLKSNNLFLQNNVIKIGDFGLSTVKRRDFCQSISNQPTGSILWMAPEVIRMDTFDPYTTKADVYSFGIVLYELMALKLPYSHIKFKDQILYLVGKGKLMPDISDIRSEFGNFLKKLYNDSIQFDPQNRLSFSEIVSQLVNYKKSLPNITRTTSAKHIRKSLESNHFSFDNVDY